MLFLLGVIVGLLLAVLVVVTVIFFRQPIEQIIDQVQPKIELAGPRPKGFIIDAIDEESDTRDEIVERNRKEGRDTPISDLRNKE